MEVAHTIAPKAGDAVLLVGTTKGAFLLCANAARRRWEVSGPHFPGHVVYALAYDGRAGRRRIWLSSFNWAYGTTLRASDDFGQTWTNPESHPIKFPEDTGQALKQIWQIAVGRAEEPDKMYCGVEPAALFESNDAGQSWSLVRTTISSARNSRQTSSTLRALMQIVPGSSIFAGKRPLMAIS